MKRVFCPKCDNQLSFDETKYPEGKVLAFVCPQCGAQFKIKLGRKVVKTATGEEKEVKEPVGSEMCIRDRSKYGA